MKTILAGVTLIALTSAAFANSHSGRVTHIHDGNLKFCIEVNEPGLGERYYFVPQDHNQRSFTAAYAADLDVTFDAMPDTVTCDLPKGGVAAKTIRGDVDF